SQSQYDSVRKTRREHDRAPHWARFGHGSHTALALVANEVDRKCFGKTPYGPPRPLGGAAPVVAPGRDRGNPAGPRPRVSRTRRTRAPRPGRERRRGVGGGGRGQACAGAPLRERM